MPTLEDPVLIVRDAEEGTLFIKSFVTKSNQKIFVSVAHDENGLKLIVSNAERELRQIIGKVKQGQLLCCTRNKRVKRGVLPSLRDCQHRCHPAFVGAHAVSRVDLLDNTIILQLLSTRNVPRLHSAYLEMSDDEIERNPDAPGRT